MTILVVDDELLSRESLRALLALKGYRVLVAEDGPQGVSAARRRRPDLVVVHHGGRDPSRTVGALQADPASAGVPLLILSKGGKGGRGDVLLAEALGRPARAVDYEDLIEKIRIILET